VHDDLASAVDADFARTRKELEELVRIPSVSAPDSTPQRGGVPPKPSPIS
jgi:hypothetical protein